MCVTGQRRLCRSDKYTTAHFFLCDCPPSSLLQELPPIGTSALSSTAPLPLHASLHCDTLQPVSLPLSPENRFLFTFPIGMLLTPVLSSVDRSTDERRGAAGGRGVCLRVVRHSSLMCSFTGVARWGREADLQLRRSLWQYGRGERPCSCAGNLVLGLCHAGLGKRGCCLES